MSDEPMDARPISAGYVVLEIFRKKLICQLLLSSLWDLRSCWFVHNICLSRLAVCYRSRVAAQSTRAACDHQFSPDVTLGHLPPSCCGLFGFGAGVTLSSSTLAYILMCNLGSINNVFAVVLAVHSGSISHSACQEHL